MKSVRCEEVKDLLPEWTADLLVHARREAVETHLPDCAECREEAELLRAVLASRPTAPEGLEARIQARVREDFSRAPATHEGTVRALRPRPGRLWAPAWALSAAALAALSLGIGVLWNGNLPEVTIEPVEVASQEPLPEAWLWDDGVVAGAPVFDDLTDEELQALIEEMEG